MDISLWHHGVIFYARIIISSQYYNPVTIFTFEEISKQGKSTSKTRCMAYSSGFSFKSSRQLQGLLLDSEIIVCFGDKRECISITQNALHLAKAGFWWQNGACQRAWSHNGCGHRSCNQCPQQERSCRNEVFDEVSLNFDTQHEH